MRKSISTWQVGPENKTLVLIATDLYNIGRFVDAKYDSIRSQVKREIFYLEKMEDEVFPRSEGWPGELLEQNNVEEFLNHMNEMV